MTTNVTVSVNGGYQVPVVITTDDGQSSTTIVSGAGHDGPDEKTFGLPHGNGTISVGPETPATRTEDANFSREQYDKASGPAAASSSQGARPDRVDALNPEEDRRDAAAGRIQTPPMENEQPEPQTGNPSASEMTKSKNPPDVND